MRRADVYFDGVHAGILEESDNGNVYVFRYDAGYAGRPISLTMPVQAAEYRYDAFPPFFDGLLPEGVLLDALLQTMKIDRNDYFAQLVAVGGDLVGAVTVEPAK